MKIYLFFIICLFCVFQIFAQTTTGTLTDMRDGKVYETIKIGDQWWMSENLNIGTMVNGITPGTHQTNNNVIEKYCYADDVSNCNTYGGLYDWNELMNYTEGSNTVPSMITGICPQGWHLPSDSEWKIMEIYLGMSWVDANKINLIRGNNQGDKIKESGTIHWASPNTGTNESGFNALPAGNRHNYALMYGNLGISFNFATSSDTVYSNNPTVITRFCQNNYSTIGRGIDATKSDFAISVRCVKDDVTGIGGKIEFSDISVYPNPCRDFVCINFGDFKKLNGYSLKIVNSLGQTVYNSWINKQGITIDLKSISGKGLYFVQILDSANNILEINKLFRE